MIRPRIEELLQRQLDGDLIDGEANELALLLTDDPQGQELQAQLWAVHDGLTSIPFEPATPGFADATLLEIEAQTPSKASTKSRRFSSRPSTTPWRPSLREVLAFAAGLGFVLVFRVFDVGAPQIDGELAAGALVTPAGQAIDAQSIGLSAGHIEATSASMDEGTRVELSGSPSKATDIELRFDAGAWYIAGFEGAEHANLGMEAGLVRFTQDSAFRFVVEMRPIGRSATQPPLRIRATEDGEVRVTDLMLTTGGRR